jgi:hypothetical protein
VWLCVWCVLQQSKTRAVRVCSVCVCVGASNVVQHCWLSSAATDDQMMRFRLFLAPVVSHPALTATLQHNIFNAIHVLQYNRKYNRKYSTVHYTN